MCGWGFIYIPGDKINIFANVYVLIAKFECTAGSNSQNECMAGSNSQNECEAGGFFKPQVSKINIFALVYMSCMCNSQI